MTTSRQVVKARDIQNFFGKKERQSFKMMGELRKHFLKKAHQPITIGDFCQYYNVKSEELNCAMQATDEFENKSAAKRKNQNNPMQQQSSIETDIEQLKETKPYTFSKINW